MFKKLLALKEQRNQALAKAKEALLAGEADAHTDAMNKIDDLNKQIENVSKLLDEERRTFSHGAVDAAVPGTAPGTECSDPSEVTRAEELRKMLSSDSYKRSFFKALAAGVSSKRYNPEYADLYKALTISGGDPVGSEGGFLVPVDFETRVIKLAKEMVDLSAYANVQPVSAPTGWRTVELSAARSRMTAPGEGKPIPAGEGPRFKRVDFACKTYSERIPISGELMEDADALMDYVAEWFAAKLVATKNGLILDKLNALEFEAIAGADDAAKIKGIKSVLNKGLRTAVSKKAILLTNQNGYDDMDLMADGNGRPFLKPDVSGDFDRFKNRPVVYGDNDVIEDIVDGDQTYDPLYIGDLASFVTLFIRRGMRMDVTNVGGDAWENGGYEVRVMCSMDAQTVDETAMVKRGILQA